MSGGWLPVGVIASSLVAGLAIFLIDEQARRLREVINIGAALVKLLLVAILFYGVVRHGHSFDVRYQILPGFDFLLRVDLLSLFFLTLSSVLWLLTTLYAIGYLEGSDHRKRFFGFFSLCVTASVGIALAGNLITFFIFYEFLTLTTYPLVVHRGTRKALAAGRTYLLYTMSGGALLFFGVVWLHAMADSFDFGDTNVIRDLAEANGVQLVILFFLFVIALGVKAALVPLHGWLPLAMIAPAPVSALLHAVAVVKAGAFGLLRLVQDVYGIHLAQEKGLLTPLAVAAAVTILYGSIRALFQRDLKRRLAFSTVSQVSYIALGVAIFGPLATIGSLVHLVHQGLMKITLFFCAGNFAETLGIHNIDELAGVGRRMPWTMTAFTVAAFGMIGVPPTAGFISKWYLGTGALSAGQTWVIGVLVASTLLNAAYFLPILHIGWFQKPAKPWAPAKVARFAETSRMLLIPALVTAALSLAVGLFAASPFSPLDLAVQITERVYAK